MRKIETDNYDVDFIEEVEVTELPAESAQPPRVAYVADDWVDPLLLATCPWYHKAYAVAS